MPVSREDVERIIASVPGFQTRWDAFLKEWETEPSLSYYLVAAAQDVRGLVRNCSFLRNNVDEVMSRCATDALSIWHIGSYYHYPQSGPHGAKRYVTFRTTNKSEYITPSTASS